MTPLTTFPHDQTELKKKTNPKNEGIFHEEEEGGGQQNLEPQTGQKSADFSGRVAERPDEFFGVL